VRCAYVRVHMMYDAFLILRVVLSCDRGLRLKDIRAIQEVYIDMYHNRFLRTNFSGRFHHEASVCWGPLSSAS
jgi:hypothetical protein